MTANKIPVGLVETFRHYLDYDASTGVFAWSRFSTKKRLVGKTAGATKSNGYIGITIHRKGYLAHRVAWAYVYGEWPDQIIDHINGDKQDNRISNLRHVSASMNSQNRRRPAVINKLGVLGVRLTPEGGYRAQIKTDGVVTHLGVYTDVAEAREAYLIAKREAHKGCTI